MTTRFLADILRQPAELQRSLDYLTSEHSKKALVDAATAIKGARHLFVTGIGASWHAAMNVAALFQLGGNTGAALCAEAHAGEITTRTAARPQACGAPGASSVLPRALMQFLPIELGPHPSQTGRSPPRTATSGSRQRPGVFDSFTCGASRSTSP